MQSKSFQLEQTVPGSFFFQGLAGGTLGGFILVLLVGLWVQDFHPGWARPLTALYMMMGAVVGAVKATLIWGAHRITGFQIRFKIIQHQQKGLYRLFFQLPKHPPQPKL